MFNGLGQCSKETNACFCTDELGLPAQDQSTLIEEPSIADVSRQSRRSNRSVREVETPRQEPAQPLPVEEPSLNTTDLLTTSNIGEGLVDLPAEPTVLEPIDMGPKYLDDEPPSIAPFSVAPPSVAPPSVAPPSVAPVSLCTPTFTVINCEPTVRLFHLSNQSSIG